MPLKYLLGFFITVLFLSISAHPAHAINYVRLPATYHRQQYTLSCEIASLKMALSTVSVNVSETELISKLAFDPTPKRDGIWGDPYTGFVGNINGHMMTSGYGVYWEPIANTGLHYRRTEVLTNASLQTLTTHLDSGRPIIVWGYYGTGNNASWRTPNGRHISAVHGEHARVLIGYTGPSNFPESFILLDPIYGELQWDWQTFLNNWQKLEKGAVAVYPHPRWVVAPGDPTIWEIDTDGKTRHGLAMTWDRFLNYGGKSFGIVPVGTIDIAQFTVGETIE